MPRPVLVRGCAGPKAGQAESVWSSMGISYGVGRRSGLRSMAAATALLMLTGTAACDWVGERVAEVSSGELRAAAKDPEVRAFYEKRQWRAAWSPDSEKALLAALDGAIRHGLDPSAFVRLIQAAEGDARRDAELTMAALTFAKALSAGAIAPETVHPIYTLDRPKVDVAAGLDQALTANALGGWLDGLAPTDAEYRALSEAYVSYRARADQAKAAPIPVGGEIRVGTADPRTPLIAQRLADGGYLPSVQGAAPVGEVFTREMSDALKSLQRDARQTADGIVRDATVEALNETSADRARQLAINLERRRWLARNPPATRIDVNTAATQLVYFRDGQPAWTSRTVAGTRENATPQLGETFKQLVVNPPWNVPDGIAEEEIFPKGPGYLEANDMYVDNGRVIQRPGPKAALGAVKFDMQNRYAIYLHDTPAKSIFQSEARHRSHGCVRVDKAVEFARFLAAEHGQAEAFDAALASGETKVVPLNADVPVRLLYHTAYLDQSGLLVFADDPYRWDDMVAEAMGLAPARQRGVGPEVVAELGP